MKVFFFVIKYLLGTIRLELKGEFCERFLNILAVNKIMFWSVYKRKDAFYIQIYKKDLLKVKKLRRKTLIKIKIVKKFGAFKLAHKYKNRYGILVGAVCFILILNFMSNRTWVFKITGNIENKESEIIATLNELGVYIGIKTKDINTDVLKQRLILSYDNLSWASLNKQASVLEVNLKEYDSQTLNEEEPCNIVALTDGIIAEVKVNMGLAEVKTGQTVKKGQLLVSGIISDSGNKKAVRAAAEIYAFVPDVFKTEILKQDNIKIYSEDVIKKRTVEVFGIKLPLFLNIPKTDCDIEKSVNNVKFFKKQLPIRIHTTTYKPYKTKQIEIVTNEVLNIAEERLKAEMDILKVKNYEIISCDVVETEKSFIYSARIRKTIDIAQTQKLKIIDEN